MGQVVSKTIAFIETTTNEFKNRNKHSLRRSPSHDNFVQNLEEVFITQSKKI